MSTKKIKMGVRKNIALIAHDNRKKDLLEWAAFNKELLRNHNLFATGTTGQIISKETGLNVTRFQSGPLGGDQQVGAKITEGKLDFLIFFWDPLLPQPHDPDVKALLRIAVVWNIPVACNRACYYFLVLSHFLYEPYKRDIGGEIVPMACYPNTFRRRLIDFAVKIVTTGRKVILKATAGVFEQLHLTTLWERVPTPQPIWST
jgi:methylglyoxal synthase